MKKTSTRVIAKKVRKNLKAQIDLLNGTTKSKPVPIITNKVIENNHTQLRVRTLIGADDL